MSLPEPKRIILAGETPEGHRHGQAYWGPGDFFNFAAADAEEFDAFVFRLRKFQEDPSSEPHQLFTFQDPMYGNTHYLTWRGARALKLVSPAYAVKVHGSAMQKSIRDRIAIADPDGRIH